MGKWARTCRGSLGGKLCHSSTVLDILPVDGLHIVVSLIRLGIRGVVALAVIVGREPSLDWAMASLKGDRGRRLPLRRLLMLLLPLMQLRL